MLLVLAATGVLRGLQDTRTPMVAATVGAVANVVLNLALVYGAGLGIAGSALGTDLAQLGMAVALAAVVVRGARRHGVSGRPHGAGIRAAATVGVPLLVRTLTLRAALLVATYVAAAAGTVAVAAHQVAFTVWTLLALALDAVAIAGQAIVGRALGAGDAEGARAATRRMMQWGIVSGVLLAVVLILVRAAFVPLFTDDAEVRALLSSVLVVAALFQPVSGVVFALDGVLIGAGDGRYLALAGVAHPGGVRAAGRARAGHRRGAGRAVVGVRRLHGGPAGHAAVARAHRTLAGDRPDNPVIPTPNRQPENDHGSVIICP